MGLSLDDFLTRLQRAPLLDEKVVQQVVAELRRLKPQADGEALARMLVQKKLLTAWQAQHIFKGKASALVIGNYVVLDKLGQGGMGMVLKAEHRRMQRIVALKVLSPDVVKTPELLERFQREVRAAARLTHPNVVTAYDADETNGIHYLVMEYVPGVDLAAYVRRHGPLPISKAIDCVVQAARGLLHAHEHGVVHRDIKPANLLLDEAGQVKILDMGLARIDSAEQGQAELTGTGAVMGTIDYMAPEQALSTRSADARSDQYSLGITLWYLLTARPAYGGDSLMSRLLAHREAPIPSLRESNSDVPVAIDTVFQRMVAKQPGDRFPSLREVIAALQDEAAPPSSPLLPQVRTPDDQLGDFLNNLNHSQDMPLLAARSAATARKSKTASAQHATVIATDASVATDTHWKLQAPAVTRNLGERLAPWIRNRKLQAVAAVLLLSALILPFLRNATPRAAIPTAGPADTDALSPVEPGSVTTNETANRSSAIHATQTVLQLAGDWDSRVEIPAPQVDINQPFSIQADVTLESVESFSPLVTFQSSGVVMLSLSRRSAAEGDGVAATFLTANPQTGQGRVVNATAPLAVGRRSRLLGVATPEAHRLYLDGQLLGTSATPLTTEYSSALAQTNRIGGGGYRGLIENLLIQQAAATQSDSLPGADVVPDATARAFYSLHPDSNGPEARDEVTGLAAQIVAGVWSPRWQAIQDINARAAARLGAPPPQPAPAQTTPPAASEPNHALIFSKASRAWIPTLLDLSQPWTIEFRCRLEDVQQRMRLLDGNGIVVGVQDARVFAAVTDRARTQIEQSGQTLNAFQEKFFHVAVVADGQSIRVYVHGESQPHSLHGSPPLATPGLSGFLFGGGQQDGFTGLIDELRISRGVRYKENFTPPLANNRLAADAQTLGLWHFDEGEGELARDVSGHGHDAQLWRMNWYQDTRFTGKASVETPPQTSSTTTSSLQPATRGPGFVTTQQRGPCIAVQPASFTLSRPKTIEAIVQIDDFRRAGWLFFQNPQDFIGLQIVESSDGKHLSFGAVQTAERRFALSLARFEPYLGQRIHIAGVWTGESSQLFVNGKLLQQDAARPEREISVFAPPGRIGGGKVDGVIYEARLSNGALYTGDFSPPDQLPVEADTLSAYNLRNPDQQPVDLADHRAAGRVFPVNAPELLPQGLPERLDDLARGADWIPVLSRISFLPPNAVQADGDVATITAKRSWTPCFNVLGDFLVRFDLLLNEDASSTSIHPRLDASDQTSAQRHFWACDQVFLQFMQQPDRTQNEFKQLFVHTIPPDNWRDGALDLAIAVVDGTQAAYIDGIKVGEFTVESVPQKIFGFYIPYSDQRIRNLRATPLDGALGRVPQ